MPVIGFCYSDNVSQAGEAVNVQSRSRTKVYFFCNKPRFAEFFMLEVKKIRDQNRGKRFKNIYRVCRQGFI